MSEDPSEKSPSENNGPCPTPPITVDESSPGLLQMLARRLEPTLPIGQYYNLERQVFSHVIKRSDFFVELPETLRSTGDLELLALHEELAMTQRSSNRAARSLEAFIRARKIPISRKDLGPTTIEMGAVVVARIKLGIPFEEISLSDYHPKSNSNGHILEFVATTAAAKRLQQREAGYHSELLFPGEDQIIERAAIANVAGLEAEGLDYHWIEDLKLPGGRRIDKLWMRIGHVSKDVWPSGADKVMKLAYALRLSADPRTGHLIERFPQYHPAEWANKEDSRGVLIDPFSAFVVSLSQTNIRLLNKLVSKTRDLIYTHSQKVLRIAEALLTRKRLSYQECVDLFYREGA